MCKDATIFEPIEIKTENICAKGRHPEDILSNKCTNDFCFDGVQCTSMENFLQSLKYKDAEIQLKICIADVWQLKDYDSIEWQKEQTLWWKGRPIKRQSIKYRNLIYDAYCEMYLWCGRFRDSLMRTDHRTLRYDSGHCNPQECVQTDKEFIGVLSKLRRKKRMEYMEVSYPRLWPNSYGVSEDYE